MKFASHGLLATCLTWLQAGRPNHHEGPLMPPLNGSRQVSASVNLSLIVALRSCPQSPSLRQSLLCLVHRARHSQERPHGRNAEDRHHKSRERVLCDAELRKVWAGADRIGLFGTVTRPLILTPNLPFWIGRLVTKMSLERTIDPFEVWAALEHWSAERR